MKACESSTGYQYQKGDEVKEQLRLFIDHTFLL